MLLGLWLQVLPLRQHERVGAVEDPPQPPPQRDRYVLRVKAEEGEGEDALAEVEEAVEEDKLDVEPAAAVHDDGPDAQGKT